MNEGLARMVDFKWWISRPNNLRFPIPAMNLLATSIKAVLKMVSTVNAKFFLARMAAASSGIYCMQWWSYKLNKDGARTDPYGTPLLVLIFSSPMCTCISVKVRMMSSTRCFSLIDWALLRRTVKSKECLMLPIAFTKSKKIKISLLLGKRLDSRMLYINRVKFFYDEHSARKPD